MSNELTRHFIETTGEDIWKVLSKKEWPSILIHSDVIWETLTFSLVDILFLLVYFSEYKIGTIYLYIYYIYMCPIHIKCTFRLII